jgi:hypothetical protein
MEFKQVAIDGLVLDPHNARLHNDRNKDAVRASISEFGQVEVLVVQKGTNVVIGGNCRLQEMRRLGHETAWVAEVDIDDTKAKRLALALNRTGDLAGWDDKVLSALMIELEKSDDSLNLGWNDVELDKILADADSGWLDEFEQIEPEQGADSLAPRPENGDGEGPGSEELVNPGLGASTITATIVFDDEAQQKRFRKFVRWCRKTYPSETMAASLDLHIQGVGDEPV